MNTALPEASNLILNLINIGMKEATCLELQLNLGKVFSISFDRTTTVVILLLIDVIIQVN